MELQLKDKLIRVVVLSVDGLYSQIYDEIYCDEKKYEELLKNFCDTGRYRVIRI